ncbi:MAG: sigma-54 dependent transcriptional regulator [Haliea sp.]
MSAQQSEEESGEPVCPLGDFTYSASRLPKSIHLIGDSPAMSEVRSLMARVAEAEAATVLVLGESGTGKELVAQGVHALSARAEKPFVPVNCGAIPGELLESELFGHEKGAFTGALSRRRGRFELAEGGTLFLDEIGDMPVPMQVKLLRVLQDRSFERVGGAETIATDVRIIAATHRDIEAHIAEGLFREDLYYRLNVFPIRVPPLRRRKEDLPLLIRHFGSLVAERGNDATTFSPAAMASLQAYDWPGNVRELSNLIERMAIMHRGREVQLRDLPERYVQGRVAVCSDPPAPLPAEPAPPCEACATPVLPEDGINLKKCLANMEVALVRQALRRTGGVVAHSAQLLGLQRTTLVEKLKKYGIDPESS